VAQVSNIGNAAAGPFSVDLDIELGWAPTMLRRQATSINIASLAAGASTSVSFAFKQIVGATNPFRAQATAMAAFADSTNAVVEGGEENNRLRRRVKP
jgi:hypothetical protein